MMKNHFIAMSLINGDPFGVCHRCATTSRIEYRDAVKIHASRKAIPNADRTGDFAGRASRPRSMNGRINRKMTGIPLRMSPQNAALKFVLRGVPSPMMNCGKTSATFSRPQENRRYQSGTISSEICGLRAGPRNGVTTAERKKRMATNRKIRTKSRAVSCGKKGIPGWWSDLTGPYCRGKPGIPSMIFPLTCSISMVDLSGVPRPLAARRAPCARP